MVAEDVVVVEVEEEVSVAGAAEEEALAAVEVAEEALVAGGAAVFPAANPEATAAAGEISRVVLRGVFPVGQGAIIVRDPRAAAALGLGPPLLRDEPGRAKRVARWARAIARRNVRPGALPEPRSVRRVEAPRANSARA